MTFRPVTIEDTRVVTHEAATTNSVSVGSSVGDAAREAVEETLSYGELTDAYQRQIDHTNFLRETYLGRIATLRERLAAAETALADRDRHFMWDDRLRMEREIGDLATRLATAEAERDRLLRQIARVRACPCISGASCDELDTLYDLAAGRAPSTGTTPP